MELIYLYLGNINRQLRDQGIHFGNRFRVVYNSQEKDLTITKYKDEQPCIYGERFRSFDLLVGRNGTSKSTILNLLGLPQQSRYSVLPYTSHGDVLDPDAAAYTWFALYHIGEDRFAVEGYCADMLQFLKSDTVLWQPLYSAAFQYDFENQRAVSPAMFLQNAFVNRERCASEELFYVLYESDSGVHWYDPPYGKEHPKSDTSAGFLCQRLYAAHSSYGGIVHYLHDSIYNHEFASKMASKPGVTINIKLEQAPGDKFADDVNGNYEQRNEEQTDEMSIQLGRLIYRAGFSVLDPFPFSLTRTFDQMQYAEENLTYKETMVLVYLERLASNVIVYELTQRTAQGTAHLKHGFGCYRGGDNYEQKKEYLLACLKSYDETKFFITGEIVEGIEDIPDKFFVSGLEVSIPIQKMGERNFLAKLMLGWDKNSFADHIIDRRNYLQISFTGISTGEAQYLDLYAALYHAITTSRHCENDTCVLLLDEPDCWFHPEWSRNFVLNLTELLETDEFRKYRYQVIITTHSPLLVSDVPRESIHCLRRDEGSERVSIHNSSHGFMSNLSDLLTDSFFANSVFGAYSEQYVNRLIADIVAAEKLQESNWERAAAQVPELRRRLDNIEDHVIWQSLSWRLQRLESGNI